MGGWGQGGDERNEEMTGEEHEKHKPQTREEERRGGKWGEEGR